MQKYYVILDMTPYSERSEDYIQIGISELNKNFNLGDNPNHAVNLAELKTEKPNLQACYELEDTDVSCGSHCYPHCTDIDNTDINYNHLLILPSTPFTCYLDKDTYGKYDMFYSKYSKLDVKYDTYKLHNNECMIYNKSVSMVLDKPYTIDSDKYCEVFVFLQVCSNTQKPGVLGQRYFGYIALRVPNS